MRFHLPFLLLVLTGLHCTREVMRPSVQPGVIEGQTFHATLLIDGHDYDGTILRNCRFEGITGDGLQIRDVNNLRIEDCVFTDITGDAIRFRNSGSSDGVRIINNVIHDIGENGILAPERHTNAIIRGNSIYAVATDNSASRFGHPHHGIYWQGTNVTVVENEIDDVRNDGGNGISIRTYGTIARNRLSRAADHGISYYSDHPGEGESLLIENNMIFDNGQRGINLASDGTEANHIGAARIRFNTILSHDHSPVGIDDRLRGLAVELLGNVAIRTDGGSNYVYTTLPYTQAGNVTGEGDIGFLDFTRRDLRITESSVANGAAAGIDDFPATDFEGDPRGGGQLDAGADELE